MTRDELAAALQTTTGLPGDFEPLAGAILAALPSPASQDDEMAARGDNFGIRDGRVLTDGPLSLDIADTFTVGQITDDDNGNTVVLYRVSRAALPSRSEVPQDGLEGWGAALIPPGEPCPICGPKGHGLHEDDSYGACVTCREYVAHTDDETRLVPWPCVHARSDVPQDGLRTAAQGLVDALEYVPGSALGGKIALVVAALAAVDRTGQGEPE